VVVDLSGALRAAQEGDESGFATLWRSLHPAVLRYLRVVVGDAAEDVASETWLQVSRGLVTFRGDIDGFRVWLFRIARHRGIDEQRRAARRPSAPFDLRGHLPELKLGTAPDAAEEAARRAETDWALALIASLPPNQAEAVMLRVVAGLDAAQAGAVLGKRAGAVRVAAMRGLRRLAATAEVQSRHPSAVAVPRARSASAQQALPSEPAPPTKPSGPAPLSAPVEPQRLVACLPASRL
jgi:RNA polymerase sigma-70 factor (ECF subfamily)